MNNRGEVLVAMVSARPGSEVNFLDDFLQNFACWMQISHIPQYMMFAMDEASYKAAKLLQMPVVRGDLLLRAWMHETGLANLRMEKWGDYLRLKPAISLILLQNSKRARALIWSDLDVVWFREPWDYMAKTIGDMDALFSTEVGGSANTGVYYVKNTDSAKAGLGEWVRMCIESLKLEDHGKHDQDLFNSGILKRKWPKMKLIGHGVVQNGTPLRAQITTYRPGPEELALHCNMMWGTNTKVDKLKQVSLFLAPGVREKGGENKDLASGKPRECLPLSKEVADLLKAAKRVR
mmetsp:Transcript_1587/g.2578  ORF Transcript_1587/g.2578 Transcript_1587/m.2578 type:complete len:292 (+) Transcript_1587:842-1717(+)